MVCDFGIGRLCRFDIMVVIIKWSWWLERFVIAELRVFKAVMVRWGDPLLIVH